MSKNKFLLSKENKQAFLEHLTLYMNSHNITAIQSHGDADTLVVSTAVTAASFSNVVVIGEDTDILILLLHHYQHDNTHNMFFMTDKNVKDKKIWNISEVKSKLSSKIIDCILPIHAFLGCDTFSRVHSIGKGDESLQKIMSNEQFYGDFSNFNDKDTDKINIANTGEKLCVGFTVDVMKIH